ncbi:MAG: hypothetical protein IMZ46_19290 [Acidobacteria bacterium]|nr:hypothetical protein [Acidobacteriota bacterium]
MRKRSGRVGRLIPLGIALVLAAAHAPAAESKVKTLMAGLSYDYFSRTVVWDGDTGSSRLQASLVSARTDLGFGRGLTLSLSAGLSLTDFEGLAFGTLPISLAYDASPIKGLVLGAELEAPLLKSGDFEIKAAGRFVSSFGMSKTWPLEGFSVEGEAKGRSSWMEASAGPRVACLFFGAFVPYLEVSARWLRADFRMDETLEDLQGRETKRIKGDFSVSVALGGDARVSDRLTIKAKAGFIPYAGGVDALASVGLLYLF